jgi:cytochrome c556
MSARRKQKQEKFMKRLNIRPRSNYVILAVLGLSCVLTACARAPEEHKDEHSTSNDMREAIPLSVLERDHVLAEMRQMLQSTEGVVSGLAAGDMAAVQSAAALSGRRAPTTADQKLHAKFSKEFLLLGAAAHGGFDDIARLAAEGAGDKAVTAKLGDVLRACTSCHAAYRIESELAEARTAASIKVD